MPVMNPTRRDRYVGDDDTYEFRVPGSPDLTSATAAFWCRPVGEAGWQGPFACSGLTHDGQLTIPLSGVLVVGNVGKTIGDGLVVVDNAGGVATWPVEFNGHKTFRVLAAPS